MSDTGHTSDAPAAAPEDLDQRVQALIDEIEHTTARIEQAVADDADEPEAAHPEDGPGAQPDAGADAQPENASAQPEDAPKPEAPPQPESAAAGEASPHAEAPVEHAPQEPPAPKPPAEAQSQPEPEATDDQPPELEAIWEPQGDYHDAPPPPPPPPPAQPSAASAPPQSLDSLDADLEADLDRLLAAEACADPRSDAATEEAPAQPDPELEQELDELLREGEITAPDVEASASESGSSKLDQQLAGLRDDDLHGDPEPSRQGPQEHASPAPATGPTQSSPQPPAQTPAAAEKPSRTPLVRAAMIELADFVRRGGPQVARRVEPVAYHAAAAMSKPLEERSRAKQVIGWLALYTAFLAACVWVYVLFLRPAGPPESGEQGAALVGVGE